jgi:hypothetical protein
MNLLSVETLPWIVAACLAARLLLVAARLEIARGELTRLQQRLGATQALLATHGGETAPASTVADDAATCEGLALEAALRHADEVTKALREGASAAAASRTTLASR